ncbi:hypothetical protein QLL95_gp0623 [Cotonvirus japonicus]|uniref:Uncharacterized protein n=1 Tax=Cotonvirus japonicus TaxID=2811091 RepID=A0ABM7NTJ5_9VIRU|nr:hypothetical protein QLL95_gp0623 [Cotonvirus japonicus]BCS83500.1 hypothetical protein [Cotonvirus japonicus]
MNDLPKIDYNKFMIESHKRKWISCLSKNLSITNKIIGHDDIIIQNNENLIIQNNENGINVVDFVDFLLKANDVHGDKYNYDYTIYNKDTVNICINCKICGKLFYANAISHLKGNGECPICVPIVHKNKYTSSEIIEKIKLKHGDIYDFSLFVYRNIRTPVTLICLKCGTKIFEKPQNILRGHKCSSCYPHKNTYTLKKFIEKSKKIYGDKLFDYTKLIYKNRKCEIFLKCNVCHKDFYHNATHHLRGAGCPVCKKKYL